MVTKIIGSTYVLAATATHHETSPLNFTRVRIASVGNTYIKIGRAIPNTDIIGTGNNTDVEFTATLSVSSILFVWSIIDIFVDGISLTNLVVDLTVGTIAADQLASGTIDKESGALDLIFLTPIATGVDISISYITRYKATANDTVLFAGDVETFSCSPGDTLSVIALGSDTTISVTEIA